MPQEDKADMSPGVSVICAFNDRQKLDTFLIPSLQKQSSPHERLLIDNTHGRYSSATEILNETARRAKFDLLMFVHQDVSLTSEHWLRDAQEAISRLKRCGAAGAAGSGRRGRWASVLHGYPPRSAGQRVRKPVKVQTLDGCLIIVPKAVFETVPFDPAHKGWYLYVANYCLDLARHGYRSHVLPGDIYHESMRPSHSGAYEGARKYIISKYREDVRTVYTTVGNWKTR